MILDQYLLGVVIRAPWMPRAFDDEGVRSDRVRAPPSSSRADPTSTLSTLIDRMTEAVVVRPAAPADMDGWIALRTALWPGFEDDHRAEVGARLSEPPAREACFVAADGSDRIVGFAEFRLREYAEDCLTSPVGYLEGIYVEPSARALGVGRALVAAGEAWALALGCTEMASDRELTNEASGAFHEALGYRETVRLVAYRKSLQWRTGS
jgi:aminoglycoside 6'-N-acetyltransferase I